MSAQAESNTRFHGRWLLIARLAWAAGFTVLTAMYALGFLAVREALSTACEDELCTLKQQIRHTDAGDQVVGWPGPPIGYADRLRPDQVDALERLDLTLDQYGWLAALQMGLPVLVYLLIAAGLFWRKSDDWMVLFASVMVATIPIANGPLPFMLVTAHSVWEWVFDSANVVALSCFLIFPLIFPTGRFVPRWTRWMALFEIVGAIIITLFSNPILASPRIKSLLVVYLLISFGTGVYAQLYRYFRMASPVERQQLKWVVVGLAGFIGIAFAALLPLDMLLTSRAAGMDPAQALLLSVIPDTLFQVILLFIPVSIAISVLRYRLWDIDIIISRTLVYGALTTSVVGLYVLIVGGLGALLQTQNTLPGIVIAILLIAFLFQPLRRRLQDMVDRFVPVPQSTAPSAPHQNKPTIPQGEDTPGSTLRGYQLLLARFVWVLTALLSISIFILGTVAQYNRIRQPCSEVQPDEQANCFVTENALHQLGLSWEALGNFYTPIATVAVLPIILLGCVVFWRKSETKIGLLFSLALVTGGSVSANQDLIVDLFHAFPNLRVPITFIHFLSNTAPGMFLCLFPDGRFVPRWTRWLLILWAADVLAVSVSNFLIPSFGNSLWRQLLDPPGMILLIVVGIYAFMFRYRHDAGPLQREQIKWVIVAGVVANIFMIGFKVLGLFWQPGFFDLFVIMVYSPLWYLGALFAGICIGISIFRYRLWDIDFLINRTLVYGALTGIIVSAFVLIVGFLSVLFQSSGNSIIAIIATGLLALLFNPLRQRLQRGVNHLMYGERDDPYVALSRLGRRLEASLAPEAVLPTVVRTVRDVLKLPYVAIYLQQDSHGYKIVAESASPSLRMEGGRILVPGMNREGLCIPLIHQGETLGYIVLGPRAPNEAFSSTDLHLLDDLTPQVGVAVHAVRLTADLQRSREQLVLAREEERRRLRRDLHDDLAPTLASLGLTASTVADLIPTNPTTATKLVKELQAEIRATVGNIRRLVYDLRPPTLDELGLLAAVRERAAQYSNAPGGVHMTVDAPTELPALPAAVEVAAYRIVQEALENVSKHSQARTCSIRFTNHNGLVIEIMDDGIGLPPNITPGVGLRSMRERAEELGGSCVIERGVNSGTYVLACLPIGEFNGTLARPDRG